MWSPVIQSASVASAPDPRACSLPTQRHQTPGGVPVHILHFPGDTLNGDTMVIARWIAHPTIFTLPEQVLSLLSSLQGKCTVVGDVAAPKTKSKSERDRRVSPHSYHWPTASRPTEYRTPPTQMYNVGQLGRRNQEKKEAKVAIT